MPNSSGGPIVLAALILGAAVMGGAYMVSSSVDAGIEELAGVRTALSDLEGSFEAAAAPSRPAPTRSRGCMSI